MSTWIRVARSIHDDPKVGRLAARLGVTVNEAVGIVIGVLVQMPDHAPDGDLREIEPLVLARWADWRGDAGQFADAFRALFLDTEGVWQAWREHNGDALARAQRDAERKRELRESADGVRTARAARADGVRTAHGRRTYETDDTNETNTTAAAAAVVADSNSGGRHVERLRQVVGEASGTGRPTEHVVARMRATKAGREEAVAALLLAELDGSSGRAPVTLEVLNRALGELAAHPTAEFSARSLAGFIRGCLSAAQDGAGRPRTPQPTRTPGPHDPPDYAAILRQQAQAKEAA